MRTLLKKKRENLESVNDTLSQEIREINDQSLHFSNYDKWCIQFGNKLGSGLRHIKEAKEPGEIKNEQFNHNYGDNNQGASMDKDLMNSLTFTQPQNKNGASDKFSSLLYNRMKDMVFGSKPKEWKVNNKRQIGLVYKLIKTNNLLTLDARSNLSSKEIQS